MIVLEGVEFKLLDVSGKFVKIDGYGKELFEFWKMDKKG